jgi:hypothetical protein
MTSMTTRRGKVYDLLIARFSYLHSPLDFYLIGIDRIENTDKTGFLMASPEKALCDKLVFTRNLNIASPRALLDFLHGLCRKDQRVIDCRVFERCLHDLGQNVVLFILMRWFCREYRLNQILENWQMCRNNSRQHFSDTLMMVEPSQKRTVS